MEAIVVDKFIDKRTDPVNLTVYGDLHEDSRMCNIKKLHEHMNHRAKLKNAMFVGIGDMSDWILPSDKRYTPSNTRIDAIHPGYDDLIDREIMRQAEFYKKFPWAVLGMGNHCLKPLKVHYTNPAERLAQILGCKYGGYSGFLRIRIRQKGKMKNYVSSDIVGSVTILYHHGAWGGRVIKGFGGARDWGRAHEGWDVLCYGHSHQTVVHQEVRKMMTHRGNIVDKDVYIVNCGTFYSGVADGGPPSYAERGGFPPVSVGAPLITITPCEQSIPHISISVGDC
ncbi:MAG: hypothetical protein WC444_05055 [Candidatus Paceibacterota bacterium]